MDASKLNKCLPYTFAAFEEADVIITDAEPPFDIAERARRAGIEIVIA